jgi:hypothetical protein
MEVSFAGKINDFHGFSHASYAAMFDCFWWEITTDKELKQPSAG